MRIIKLTEETKNNLMNDLLKRSPNNYSQYESTVNEIIENVRVNKNKAVFEYTKKFDRFDLNEENIKVTKEEIAAIITHATMYVGWPKGWAVFRLAKDIWTD